MTERNGIRRSLGWKAGANVILIAVIIGATAVCTIWGFGYKLEEAERT